MRFWKQTRLPEAMVLLVAAVLLLARLGVDELGSADEAIHAQVAREMAADGHWLYPTYRGEPYLEKPPLKFWLTALTYRVAGESEFTARIWSALFALGTVGGVMRLGRLLFNRGVGLASGLVLVTTWEFLFNHCARTGEMDSGLLFFMVFTVSAAWQFRMTTRAGHLYTAACWMALGFLTKGHVALLPLTWLPLVWWIGGNRRAFLDRRTATHLALAAVLFLTVVSPWFWLQLRHYGSGFWDYTVRHNLTGYMQGTIERADTSIWYYLERMVWLDYPWLPVAGLGALLCFRRDLVADFQRIQPVRWWLLAWMVMTIVVLSFSRTKLPWYHLPVLLPMSILTGFILERWWRPGLQASIRRWDGLWLVSHVGLFFLTTGFFACMRDYGAAWIHGNQQALANWHHYFLVDPNQRSALVALVVLPVLVGAWMAGGAWLRRFSPVAADLTAPARVLLLMGIATAFMGRELFQPRVSERARDTIRELVETRATKGSRLTVHLFDSFRERAPHYTVSPALYYYLASEPRVRIRTNPPDRDQWLGLISHPPGPCVTVTPAAWLGQASAQNTRLVFLKQIHESHLIFLPARTNLSIAGSILSGPPS